MNKLIIKERELLNAWKSYITEMFGEDRGEEPEENQCNEEGPEILKSEVRHALKLAKDGRCPGPDEIPVELLKLIDEDNMRHLVKLFNSIYSIEEIPDD